MEKNWKEISRRILDLTLEIISLLSGQDYIIVKKTSRGNPIIHESEGWTPITEPHPMIHEILELAHKMMKLLTGEVPIRCQDVAVYFSMEEWEYIKGHKDLYKEVMMENDLPGMDEDRSHMGARILDLTLETIGLITGEHCIVVKKVPGDCVAPRVSGGWSGSQGLITEPHPLILEKILELTHKMMELLTVEVPVRCQDVVVYFSMEERKYFEGHKYLYKEAMMEDHRPLTSPDSAGTGVTGGTAYAVGAGMAAGTEDERTGVQTRLEALEAREGSCLLRLEWDTEPDSTDSPNKTSEDDGERDLEDLERRLLPESLEK
ncbi:uncharacterized protein LOC121001564 [Bufo bufo]|uniref:uncharacterized protein LOC121001564 n=1 Tax=Bufo bufo TaxID=8384 RepID=UPI001ABE5322|nr:uncharacterized protein LOC121001564 [Bufo bufo]